MILKELSTKGEMLECFDVLKELYPTLTKESYASELDNMIPNNKYGQIAIYQGENCVGLSGYWIGTKLWCGKYLEIDNLVVSSKIRSQGAGKLMFDYLKDKARSEKCSMIALDSYTSNFKAHKFFYNQGFAPKGFHFINILEKEMIR